MAKNRSTETNARHEARAEGYLLDSVGQGRQAANYESVPSWLGFGGKLSTKIHFTD